MDTPQPVTATSTSVAPGMFGTKVPTTVSYVIAILLFLLPFLDIKCNNMSIQTVSGLQLATGFDMKSDHSRNSLFDEGNSSSFAKKEHKDPNIYALIALGLGVLGLALSFVKAKASIGGAMVTGIAAAGAMVGLLLDLKKDIKSGVPLDDVNGVIKVEFTPWFYITLIAFIAAAFFCYRRMAAPKST